jgi:anti-anti-sigma regulatory factor
MADYERFNVKQVDGVTVICPVDKELSDLVLQDELHQQLMSFLESEKPAKLLINFGVVEYCTTGIINSLLSVKKRVIANEGQFKMCELTQHVHDAFRALNLEGTVFEVLDSETDAIASFV